MPDPDEAFAPLLEAIGIVRGELRAEQAVVGFCGGPFTVAGYLVEGKPSREFATVKALMYREPEVWHALMDKLADCFASYVAAQVRAGADVVQLFDSWVGALSPADYDEFVAPWSARILAAVDVPTIHFGTGASTLLPAMARAGGDVIGLDWRIALDDGWATSVRTAPSRATSIRPCCSARGSASRRRRATCSRAPAAGPATSSTSGTACCRAPTPTRFRGWLRWCRSPRSRQPSDPDLPAGELEAVFGTAAPPEEVLDLRGKAFCVDDGCLARDLR